jgi:hypothetical protein
LILSQKLDPEDLGELAEKLSGFEITGTNAAAAGGIMNVVVTRPEGNGVVRHMITMRHEKAGWKVQDISGEGKLTKPIFVPRKKPGR